VRRNLGNLRPHSVVRQVLRALLDMTNNVCVVIALRHLSLTMFYILVFTSPLVISLLSAVFIGERMTSKKAIAMLTGFCGVVIAVAPWSHAQRIDLIGLVSCLVCVACFSVNMVWSRVLTRTESPESLATLHDVAVIATVGSPKQKGKDKYTGRDALFGSAALARKSETIVTVGWTDDDDPNSVRKVVVMPRTGQSETLFFTWLNGRFDLTKEPQAVLNTGADGMQRITDAVKSMCGLNEPIKYRPSMCPERSYYRWATWAADAGIIRKSQGRYYLVA
jgi:hypothetical protein